MCQQVLAGPSPPLFGQNPKASIFFSGESPFSSSARISQVIQSPANWSCSKTFLLRNLLIIVLAFLISYHLWIQLITRRLNLDGTNILILTSIVLYLMLATLILVLLWVVCLEVSIYATTRRFALFNYSITWWYALSCCTVLTRIIISSLRQITSSLLNLNKWVCMLFTLFTLT